MKTFARLFFLIGVVLGVYLWVSPDTLKFVSIPADSSMVTPTPPAAQAKVTEESAPVARPAQTFVEKVELVVNGVPYLFQLASLEMDHIYQEAKAFCASNSEAWNMSGDALEKGCTQVLFKNLALKIEEKSAAAAPVATTEPQTPPAATTASTVYQVNVPVTNGKTYAVSFDAAVHDPYQVSEHFCRENAEALGLQSELQITQGCVPSVGKYIAEQLDAVGFVRPNGSGAAAVTAAPAQEGAGEAA